MEEQDVVQQILARDRKALYAFYHTYQPKLHRFIQTKVNNPVDVDDILQDTLFAFLEALRDFQGKSSIQTFLFSICHHKIIDYYRRKKIKHIVFSQMPNLESLVSPLLNPEESFDVTLYKENIQMVFKKLLPRHRHILQLKYIEDLSVADIANKLAITFKSAESILFRARKAFVEAFVAT